MKTTVEIPDHLFRRAKSHCARHGISFRLLVENGLRNVLDGPAPGQRRFRLKPFGFRGEGQQIHGWPEIRESIYQGRGGAPDLYDRG